MPKEDSTIIGANVSLSCTYDLEYDKGISYIKWFFKPSSLSSSKLQEIYRFEPDKIPVKQAFPVNGIDLNVSACLIVINLNSNFY